MGKKVTAEFKGRPEPVRQAVRDAVYDLESKEQFCFSHPRDLLEDFANAIIDIVIAEIKADKRLFSQRR